MISDAPGIGHDSQCRVLVGVRYDWRAVGDEKVSDVPGLTPLVGNRDLPVITHDRAADLVDDAAARMDRLGTVRLDAVLDPPSHRFNDLPEGLLHMRSLACLVVRPFP